MRLINKIILVFLLPTALIAQDFVDIDGGDMSYILIHKKEERTVKIIVEDFQLATTEVTVAQWRKFTEAIGLDFCWEGHYWGNIADLSPTDECPIQLVRIQEAVRFCNWMSSLEGLQPVYYRIGTRLHRNKNADGYRLPTWQEWDYAARGGQESEGYDYSGSNTPEEVAWFNMEFDEGTHPVGTKAPNELGLHDMCGNIREWTWISSSIPVEEQESKELIPVRGGGWSSSRAGIRLDKDEYLLQFTWNVNGFRLARNADSE